MTTIVMIDKKNVLRNALEKSKNDSPRAEWGYI